MPHRFSTGLQVTILSGGIVSTSFAYEVPNAKAAQENQAATVLIPAYTVKRTVVEDGGTLQIKDTAIKIYDSDFVIKGSLLNAEGKAYSGDMLIGAGDIDKSSVIFAGGDYTFGTVTIGNEDAQLILDGGTVTVDVLDAKKATDKGEDAQITVKNGTLSIQKSLLAPNEQSINVLNGTLAATLDALGYKLADGKLVPNTPTVADKALFISEKGTLLLTGLEKGSVTKEELEALRTLTNGTGLLDLAETEIDVPVTPADPEKPAEPSNGSINASDLVEGVTNDTLKQVTVVDVPAEGLGTGSYGDLKLAEGVDTAAVKTGSVLTLNSSGALATKSDGKTVASFELGSGSTLATTGNDAVVGGVTGGDDAEFLVKTGSVTSTGDIVVGTVTVGTGTLTVDEGVNVKTQNLDVGQEGTAKLQKVETKEGTILGNSEIEELTVTGTLRIGNETSSAAPTLKVNTLKSGVIFADPAWNSDGRLPLDAASRVAVNEVDAGATVVAGAGSLVVVGSDNLDAAANAVRTAGYDWLGKNEGDVKSAVYVKAGDTSVAGTVLAAGWTESEFDAITTLPTDVTINAGNLMVLDVADASAPVFAGNVVNAGTLYLANLSLDDTITIGSSYTESSGAAIRFSGDRLYDADISSGSVSFTENDEAAETFGGLKTFGLVKAMYENGAQHGTSPSARFNAWLMGTSNGLSDENVVRAGNDAAALGASAGVVTVTLDAIDAFETAIRGRTAMLADRGAGTTVWADVTGGRYKAKTLFDGAGYESDIFAGVIGADTSVSCGARIGAALTVGTADTDSMNTLAVTNTDTDYFGVSLYAAHSVTDSLGIAFDLGYLTASNDVTLKSLSGGKFSADTDAVTFGARGEYRFSVDGFDVVPHAGLRWTRICIDDFEAAYRTETDSMNVFQMPIGVTVAGEFEAAGWTFAPNADLSVVPAFGDRDADMTLGIQGVNGSVTNSVRVVDTAPVQFGLGLTADKDAWRISVDYKLAAGGDDRLNNSFNLRAQYRF